MKYHLISLGCQMNASDGERVRTVIEQMGYTWTEDEKEANLIGILACSVRQNAIDKVYSKISKWNKWKNHTNLITFVSGCVLPSDHEKFLKLFDIIFQMKDLPNLPEMIHQYGITTPSGIQNGFDAQNDNISEFWNVKPDYASDFEAFVPIQNGCDKFCSFCAVPYTRGREVSRPSTEIISEVRSLVERGYKSITLLGQNVNSYGLDKPDTEVIFPELLRQVGELGNEIGTEFWLYFTSPHPRDMSDEVIEVIAQYKCLAKQIHLPLQSGDDKLLIAMNRKHGLEKYRQSVSTIRRLIPEATLFTDIIVGFTGESDEQFNATRAAMKEFDFNMAYIAKYSPRPGALSHRWFDSVSLDIKKERHQILTQDLKLTSRSYNDSMIGKTFRVLVRGAAKHDGYLAGLTEGKINVRFLSENTDLIGQIVDVKIKSATAFSVEGDLLY
ncbi:tRNA (N6-isopentenyl adenosine(37)-C2)-methylthiotransferase MiaB [Ancylomarina euxinus]|uniref:tRNA-2-methylthio-N(6)-dimethylallyladenosine synthase n=1 Tax=Ancylomarina euxinus TaxID=2283627 RepID=A0A425Y2N3_9BACT|nr:tRNA (N6-isopentenyl adenosine(37)-C2)-methylthiotransferase MiaB [Ancylomarina euxinus]MCZ4694860.1 tRNA (N6-isopentenyl adenosine(37)-C2)-methylthiotransferase MiaB [Ancylomarina euxinus]MUP14726.1 tRNA (N6-isopentenyl adenosine(37)-C2)-methylthiotransferase MiaB [Ancylomarina euxinus]RRG22076.1 tRNA (N6-isopentenyl adenosine(37)-C2)-methylthiotransferase MiaB [Ancylomarina euxinus]